MEKKEELNKPLLGDDQQPANETNWSKTRENGMIVVLLFLLFGSLCVDTLIFPFFPKIARDKGLSNTEIGIVFASYDLARFLSFPVAGSILLKWQPKSMCATGNIITSLACVCFGFLKKTDNNRLYLWLCVLVRLIAGVGSTLLTVAATSILMKCSSYSTNTIVGAIESVVGLGYALGPGFGGIFYNLTGYTPMFSILGGLLLVLLPVMLLVVPKVVETKLASKNFQQLLSIPGCFLMLITCTVNKIGGSARPAGVSNWVTSTFKTGPSTVAFLFAAWSVFYIFSCPIATKLTEKGFIYRAMVPALFVVGLLDILFGPSALLNFIFHGYKNFWMMTAVVALLYSTQSFLFVPPFQAAMDLAEVNGHPKDSLHTYGMVTGLINCGLSLGSAVGPLMAGLITDALDFSWTVAVIGFISMAMGLVMIIYLLYMKVTCQPLSPLQTIHTEDDVKKDSINKQIVSACNKRMNECMEDLTERTQLHKQQPEIDELP